MHEWPEVFNVEEINDKVSNFHQTLKGKLNCHFPQKQVKISSLDKKVDESKIINPG